MTEKKNKTILVAEPDKQEIFVMREFEAPRNLVFKAYTDPNLYVQWLGPRGYTMLLETFEPRSGGRWRFIHKNQQDNQFGSMAFTMRCCHPSGSSTPSSSKATRNRVT